MSAMPPQWQQRIEMDLKPSIIIALVALALTYNVFSQDTDQILKGQVSFVTSQNIYVMFPDTGAIVIGDSLKLESANASCLVVKSKSTTSCVCSVVEGCAIEKGDKVEYLVSVRIVQQIPEKPTEELVPVIADADERSLYKENIRGRVSASSYSIFASERDDRHRIMGRLSVYAEHIKNSKFSFNTYLNYRKILDQKESSSLQQTSLFRVYNLGVRYDAMPTLSVMVGRNINPKISSLGAIDGLQAEKYFGKKYIGAIVGFRPDIFDYGFNPDLLQYGGYIGAMTDGDKFYSQTTFGFIQQHNSGEIDRRYAYFQHSSTFSKNINIFSSLELDLYSKLNGEVSNEVRLTNLYVSARYRFSRKFNMMVSYDSRKRILYYETFQTEIERLLDDDIARQGARARINLRPFKNILVGASYSKRFQNNSENKSDNIYGYVTHSKVPGIGGRLSLSYNRNESNYLKSNIAAIRHSRSFFEGKLNADFYYRFVVYDYANFSDTQQQQYFGTNLSYTISRKLICSISGEFTTLNQENNYRIYSRIVQRF